MGVFFFFFFFLFHRRTCRYQFAHAILGPKDPCLLLPQGIVQRQRRISLMFRDEK